MSLIIHLSPESEAELAAKAPAAGMAMEHYARQILEKGLTGGDADPSGGSEDTRLLSEVIRDIVGEIPAEELAKLPSDGSNQVDHYVSCLPKRES